MRPNASKLRPTGVGKKSSHIRGIQRTTQALFPTGTGITHGPLGTTIRSNPARPSQSTGSAAYYA
jgi:hypothetical protein